MAGMVDRPSDVTERNWQTIQGSRAIGHTAISRWRAFQPDDVKSNRRVKMRGFVRRPAGNFRLTLLLPHNQVEPAASCRWEHSCQEKMMAKIAKTADRKKVMDTSKSTDCPKCSKPTRIVKRVKDRERGIPGGIYISCSACEFFEKL
jgi:hypothetical protein